MAVFWPGELSTHMRDDPRWQNRASAARSRGCVAAVWIGPDGMDASALGRLDDSLLTLLNRELFRGDLEERWHGPWSSVPAGVTASSAPYYEADPRSPGRAVIERFLARDRSARPVSADGPHVRLVYLDIPPGSPDSIVAEAAIDPGLAPRPRVFRVDRVFAFACPVLVDTAVGPYLRALGASSLVGLFDCTYHGRRP